MGDPARIRVAGGQVKCGVGRSRSGCPFSTAGVLIYLVCRLIDNPDRVRIGGINRDSLWPAAWNVKRGRFEVEIRVVRNRKISQVVDGKDAVCVSSGDRD